MWQDVDLEVILKTTQQNVIIKGLCVNGEEKSFVVQRRNPSTLVHRKKLFDVK